MSPSVAAAFGIEDLRAPLPASWDALGNSGLKAERSRSSACTSNAGSSRRRTYSRMSALSSASTTRGRAAAGSPALASVVLTDSRMVNGPHAIADRYEDAYQARGDSLMREKAAQGAQAYEVDLVVDHYWGPALHDIYAAIEAEDSNFNEAIEVMQATGG